MKLTIEHSELKRLVDLVCPIAPKSPIHILETVLISADERLSLTATDMDIEVRATADADISAKGSACVNATILRAFVGNLPKGAKIEMSRDESRLTLRAARARLSLQTLRSTDFPRLGRASTFSNSFPIETSALADLIERTIGCVSTEETRYYLNGLFLDCPEKGRLRSTSTNGNALSRASVEAGGIDRDMPSVIYPRASALALRSLLNAANGSATVDVSDTIVRVSAGDIVMLSKLIDGTFPNVDRAIPARSESPVLVERLSFLGAVARVASIVERTKDGRLVRLNISEGAIEISSAGKNSDAIEEIEGRAEHPINVGYNSVYLRTLLEATQGESVELHISDIDAPTLILSPTGTPGDLSVVMPMRA